MAKGAKSANKKSKKQVAALPIRITDDGEISVLLVSSRETKRWIIPKGWTAKNLTDAKAAAREAHEEAGVTGKISRKSVASYSYRKIMPDGAHTVEVDVYILWVKKLLKRWREQEERTRIWTSFEDAAKLVQEPRLKTLFNDLAKATQGDPSSLE